jgi:hypothetical protein
VSGSFARRSLRFTVQLALGEDPDPNTVKYDTYLLPVGLRAQATIESVGGHSMGSATCRIHGLSLSFMNKVNTLGLSPMRQRRNRLKVEASNAGGYATVFEGNIVEAWIDLDSQPESSLVISAFVGAYDKLKPTEPGSYPGVVPVVNIFQDLASKMGATLDNQGVPDSNVVSNQYLTGTAVDQMNKLARLAHVEAHLESGFTTQTTADPNKQEAGSVMVIWPEGGKRSEQAVLLSKDTGLVGYPTAGGQGNVRVRCLFHPGIGFHSQIKVQSVIEAVNKTWVVYHAVHDLSSETPDGPWFSQLEARLPSEPDPMR